MVITEGPIWYPIYADTNNIQKSTLLTELGETEENEYDEYGDRKKKGNSLKNINVKEVSLCSNPAVRATYCIVKSENEKGGDDIMDEEKAINMEETINMEDEKAEAMTSGEVKTLQTTIAILSKHGVTGDLEKARAILQKNLGKGAYPYPYPAKEVAKSNFRWSDNLQRTLRGYSDNDLLEVSKEDLEIEKSTNKNPFPSLARVVNRDKETLEEAYELATIEERAI